MSPFVISGQKSNFNDEFKLELVKTYLQNLLCKCRGRNSTSHSNIYMWFYKLARLVGLIKLPLNYKEMSYSLNKKL